MKHKSSTVISPGSRWVALGSKDWVVAHINDVQFSDYGNLVYFTVEHRPGETLSCREEAF
jgi:hypothetical protein